MKETLKELAKKNMKELILNVITELRKIDIYKLKRIKNEADFEVYVVKLLDKIINRNIKLNTQNKSYNEGRQIRPDISIGEDDLLIELKYNLKGINDIYRLYYQAIKYSKLANKILILCIHDPLNKLLPSDKKDLESINKVKVIHIY